MGCNCVRCESLCAGATRPHLPSAMVLVVARAAVLFMCCSAGMMIVNTLVLKAARLPITLVMIQMAFTSATLFVLPQLRATLHFGSQRDVWRWARALPLMFALMLLTSMLALSYASMGAFVVVRNLSPLVTLTTEGFAGERVVVDVRSVLPLFASLGGVFLYAMHDVSSHPAVASRASARHSIDGRCTSLRSASSSCLPTCLSAWPSASCPASSSRSSQSTSRRQA